MEEGELLVPPESLRVGLLQKLGAMQMLMTRAMREKLAGMRVSTPTYTKCTVRVRLPEGLLLQGMFNPDERVAAVFDWVTDCLAEPGTTYELVSSACLICKCMCAHSTTDLSTGAFQHWHSCPFLA